jgi:hypothetical protein
LFLLCSYWFQIWLICLLLTITAEFCGLTVSKETITTPTNSWAWKFDEWWMENMRLSKFKLKYVICDLKLSIIGSYVMYDLNLWGYQSWSLDSGPFKFVVMFVIEFVTCSLLLVICSRVLVGHCQVCIRFVVLVACNWK